jgi:hypothetical protein
LALFLSIYAFLSYQAMGDQHVPLLLEKEADDLLSVLDKSGVLSSMNESLINETMNVTLPPHLEWSLEMEYYNYTDGFELDSNATMGEGYHEGERRAVAQREFLVIRDRDVTHYGIARLRLWVE